MRLYAITDTKRFARDLVSEAKRWSLGGVQYIQLREKDLDQDGLGLLVQQVSEQVDRSCSRLLVNVADLPAATSALQAGADGVHLSGRLITGLADRVRAFDRNAIISVPCHSMEDVSVAAGERVDMILFSPVFEKVFGETVAAQGLDGLRQACTVARGIPVFALGGVTAGNAHECVAAGAAGIAAIRLFAGDDWRCLISNVSPENHI
jgi:thiamine-phosphate pyrophosphorylase